jgi:uncharacterized protein DUF6335
MGKRKSKLRRGAAKRATPKRATGKRTSSKRATTKRARAKSAPKNPSAATRRTRTLKKEPAADGRLREDSEDRGATIELLREVIEHHGTGPAVSAGDIDADWQRAESSGEEAAGGSVSTPDQDRVDDIGHALGVEQPAEAPLRSSEEILEERDRRYWDLERRAGRKADQRREP